MRRSYRFAQAKRDYCRIEGEFERRGRYVEHAEKDFANDESTSTTK